MQLAEACSIEARTNRVRPNPTEPTGQTVICQLSSDSWKGYAGGGVSCLVCSAHGRSQKQAVCSDRRGNPGILQAPCQQPTLRKEVIQPQVPLRLPCYDFTPVANLTVVGCLLKG